MKFIITVDTEADNQWEINSRVTLRNIEYLPKFQSLCERYNFIPTYLITYEVAKDDQAVKLLSAWQDKKKAEVGAHLHPWTTPPFMKHETGEHIYPSGLSYDDLKKKLESLTSIIKNNFKKSPISYRAGRWGFDSKQAKILLELGYIVDCSVTPKINWGQVSDKLSGARGPDFKLSNVKPHYIADRLLEVPMTILFTGLFNKENSRVARKFLLMPDNFFKKIVNKFFFQQKWLRIFPNSSEKDWQRIYKSAKKNKLGVLEFMIHSSELMPGASPYAKNKREVDFIYYQLEKMFAYFKEQGVEGISLSDFASKYY